MRLIPLLAVFVLVPLQALAQAGGRSDQEVIQGTWKSASGDAVAVFSTPGPTLQFADTRVEIVSSEGNTEKTGRFEIFQGANPPEIAFTLLDVATNKKWQRKAAYEVTEKGLKLCFHSQPMLVPTCRTAAVVLEFRR